MTVKIAFAGASGGVTGSCYRISHPGGSFLVDCGLFQGPKTLKALNYTAFPFVPAQIDFALLTHAHTDHCGLLPKLVKAGFKHPIYTTRGTLDLLTFTLPDSGYVQEMEVETLNRRNLRRGRAAVDPIYTQADAEASLKHLRACAYDEWIACGRGVRARFWNAGHILGSASIEIEIADGAAAGRPLRVVFSGDIGPRNKSFHPDPTGPAGCDYLVVESTYGNRDRADTDAASRRAQFRDEVTAALARGGNLLIPAFAVERTQELLLDLGLLMARGELPKVPVFLDSPLAIKATQVFLAHAAELEDIGAIGNPFSAPNLHLMETSEQSKSINRINGGAIIIAGSGMCDAGRIRHHLKQNLWRDDATVLFVGYQALGTLGQLLQSGVPSVRIQGDEINVRATLRSMDAYSGHADRGGLIEWVKARLPVARAIYLTHGEPDALAGLRDGLVSAGYAADRILIPELDDVFALSGERPAKQPGTARRLATGQQPAADWHNGLAALTLDLRRKLEELPDDAAREDLIARVNRLLLRHP
ncbi:MAG TPA: MBL fold metallo-hydrolase [Hypericibacter adhaerens]|jgi:metallo-beta-lactamase family protein|uniref:MBL fold metallo-hydrolase n=1 Tax=Hypericibacter adhaerens TaxID=2602016 RepID=A0A5J6MXM7_9PROT|nr:MBL fold metallo-hydrolase [Hypericibacter adhaerens]QEX22071.1 MBL fold metallo-hydrolase [Hypericibacter adhaerens]HWA46271.1 MBL fold metallo-hydrolase [Hypericibacter adhaerens]